MYKRQDKGYDVDEAYVSTLEPIHLDRVQIVPGKFVFVGEKELPTLINFRYKPGVIAVRDMFGNLIHLLYHSNHSECLVPKVLYH